MSHPQKIGITLPLLGSVQENLAYAALLEKEGFSELWFAGTGGIDALTLSAALAVTTQKARIGVMVTPVYTRSAAVLASSAATLADLSEGRFVLGIGASSHAIIEKWHGIDYERPLTRVKETTQVLKALFAGEKTNFSGETIRSTGYSLNPKPNYPIPLILAALRPKMLELAGEYADGVALNLFPRSVLPKMIKHIAIGAQRSNRPVSALELVCRHQVIVTKDKPTGRDLFRRHFAPYYATPVYNRFLAWCGYEQEAAMIREGWQEKNRDKTTAALSDSLVDELALIGEIDYCKEQLQALGAAGIHTHVLACPDPEAATILNTYRAFGKG